MRNDLPGSPPAETRPPDIAPPAAPVLGVIHPRVWWTPWRARPLDDQAVREALIGLFGQVEGFEETLGLMRDIPRGRVRREIALSWESQRVTTIWTVLLRGARILHVAVTVRDLAPDQPPADYRAELPAIIRPLHDLAADCGAHLFCGGVDLTHTEVDDICQLMAGDSVRQLPPAETDRHRHD